jgi:cytochrome c oxidase assembly protein subunit 15
MKEPSKKAYRRFAKLSLILVYLVILAGAVVRMTGSGMGCPDWPKCFGYYIPPTEEAELIWTPRRTYKKGQVIIVNEELFLARKDFTANETFMSSNWEAYTKHDYAVFNTAHTWTEYINRLLGALSGLSILVMAIFSFAWWKEKKSRVFSAWIAVLAIGFQAWLGATVVYSVLAPVRITIHMVMALLIVALLTWIVFDSKPNKSKQVSNLRIYRIWGITVFLSLIQIAFGTQVRQFIDNQDDIFGLEAKNLWLENPTVIFYVHRSFSILILFLHLWIAFSNRKLNLGYSKLNFALFSLLLILFSGVVMNYLDFPFGSQPIHLVLAAVLFGVQWHVFLEMRYAFRTHKSS